MKKVKITPSFDITIPEPEIMEQDVIYISTWYKTASHLCLCGCGELSVTPLNENGWVLEDHQNKKVSFSPSILNNNCPNRSHYVITNNIANFDYEENKK